MLHGDAGSIRIEDPTSAKVEFVLKCPAVLRDGSPGQTPGGQMRNPPPVLNPHDVGNLVRRSRRLVDGRLGARQCKGYAVV